MIIPIIKVTLFSLCVGLFLFGSIVRNDSTTITAWFFAVMCMVAGSLL